MLQAWAEWKKLCALDLCSDDTQRTLHFFAKSRFDKYLRRYSRKTDISAHSNPWHLFETHVTVKKTRQGKRYKDWLFARVATSQDAPLDIVRGGASLIMKDVTRRFLHRECSPHNTVSLNKPIINSDESSAALQDILPAEIDPVSRVCLREYEELADRHARDFLKDISWRERIVIVAKQVGLSLAHSSVEKTAGCKKSVLNVAYRDFLARIAVDLRDRYHDDDSESILTLSLMTIHQISNQLLDWAKLEKSFAHFFRLVKEKYHEIAKVETASRP